MKFEMSLEHPATNDVAQVTFKVDKAVRKANPTTHVHKLAHEKSYEIQRKDYIGWAFIGLHDENGVEVDVFLYREYN